LLGFRLKMRALCSELFLSLHGESLCRIPNRCVEGESVVMERTRVP
jgi:hypothetical protein